MTKYIFNFFAIVCLTIGLALIVAPDAAYAGTDGIGAESGDTGDTGDTGGYGPGEGPGVPGFAGRDPDAFGGKGGPGSVAALLASFDGVTTSGCIRTAAHGGYSWVSQDVAAGCPAKGDLTRN